MLLSVNSDIQPRESNKKRLNGDSSCAGRAKSLHILQSVGVGSIWKCNSYSAGLGSALVPVRLEDLRPVKTRLLVRVGTTVHGDTVLTRRHTVVWHLLIGHGARDVAAILLRGTHYRSSHVSPVCITINSTHAARSGELALITSHTVHTILNGDNAKGVDDVISCHVTKSIQVVQISSIFKSGLLLSLGILLHVSLGVRQVASAGGVATADRALLEVTLENVASGEGVPAENTHVGAITSVAEQVALQVLGMEVRLGAVRAGEFSVSILNRNNGVLCASSRSLSSRPSRSAGQDSAATLRSNDVGGLFAVLEERVRLHQ